MKFNLSTDQLPKSFEEACNQSGAKHLFDRVTKERFAQKAHMRYTCNSDEKGYNWINIPTEEIRGSVEILGYQFIKGDWLQNNKLVSDPSGLKLKKSNIDPKQYFIKSGNKLYGLPKDKKIKLLHYYPEDYFIFVNNLDTYYVTPDTNLRQERNKEILDLKANYKLLHMANTNAGNQHIPAYYSTEYINKNWKDLLDKSYLLQKAFVDVNSDPIHYSIANVLKDINTYLNNTYLKATVTNSVEYLICHD